MSADASYYYYICRVHQSIAVYTVEADGKLKYSSRCALAANSNARNLTLDPSGKFILVASQDANCVECFRIDSETGALELACTQDAPCLPRCSHLIQIPIFGLTTNRLTSFRVNKMHSELLFNHDLPPC